MDAQQHERDVETGVEEVDEEGLHGGFADGLALPDEFLDLGE